MFIIVPKQNGVEVLNERGVRKYTLNTGQLVGAPIVTGNIMTATINQGGRICNRVFDLNTGQPKFSV